MPAANRTAASRLTTLVRRLRKLYGPPVAPPITDPYRLLLWEQVAYLAEDVTRLEAYRFLEETVGTKLGVGGTEDLEDDAPVLRMLCRGVRVGDHIAISEGREAACPFPSPVPVDAYCAALVDEHFYKK